MTPPLDYGTPETSGRSGRWFAFDAFCSAGAAALPAWVIAAFVIPKAEPMFQDFGVKLPAVTAGLFAAVRRLGPTGVIAVLAGLCVGTGLVVPLLDTSPNAPPEAARRRRRMLRRVVLLLAALLLVGLVLAVALPYAAMLNELAAGGGK